MVKDGKGWEKKALKKMKKPQKPASMSTL